MLAYLLEMEQKQQSYLNCKKKDSTLMYTQWMKLMISQTPINFYFFIAPTVYSIPMNTLPLYLDRMPLQDKTIFAPENKANISFFGFGIQKIHIYQTDGSSSTYCSKTGAVGRICSHACEL
jgi:hypothetical protein